MRVIALFFLLIASSCAQQEAYKLTILHVNDTHAKHEPTIKKDAKTGVTVTNGGQAQFAGVVEEERSINPNTLVIHAGDTMTGSAYTIVYKGVESSELMNMSGISISALGNHEFDFGLSGLYDVLAARKFPTVSANVFATDTGNTVVPPYLITNLGGKNLALIGLMVNEEVFTERIGTPGFIKVEDGIETLKKLFAEDKTLNTADYFILISHSGFEYDKQIAKAFPNKFAAIIGGHSHTLLTEPVIIDGTPIVQLENNLKRVGRLDLSLKGKKVDVAYKQILLSNTAYDTAVANYIAEKKVLVDKQLGAKIGNLLGADLNDDNVRRQSIPLGNFVADTLFDIYKDKNLDLAVVNSGSIRAPLLKGDITLKNVFEFHPFDSIPVVVKMKGSFVKDMFAVSASKNWDEGGFLQVSKGVIIHTDAQRNIQQISINGMDLDPEKEYTVLISDWIYGGGDQYTMVAPNASNVDITGDYIRELFIDRIKRDKTIDANKVDKTARWVFAS